MGGTTSKYAFSPVFARLCISFLCSFLQILLNFIQPAKQNSTYTNNKQKDDQHGTGGGRLRRSSTRCSKPKQNNGKKRNQTPKRSGSIGTKKFSSKLFMKKVIVDYIVIQKFVRTK